MQEEEEWRWRKVREDRKTNFKKWTANERIREREKKKEHLSEDVVYDRVEWKTFDSAIDHSEDRKEYTENEELNECCE